MVGVIKNHEELSHREFIKESLPYIDKEGEEQRRTTRNGATIISF